MGGVFWLINLLHDVLLQKSELHEYFEPFTLIRCCPDSASTAQVCVSHAHLFSKLFNVSGTLVQQFGIVCLDCHNPIRDSHTQYHRDGNILIGERIRIDVHGHFAKGVVPFHLRFGKHLVQSEKLIIRRGHPYARVLRRFWIIWRLLFVLCCDRTHTSDQKE